MTKLLQYYSNMFSLANRSTMVTSAANAAMNQSIYEIFERLSYDCVTTVQNDILNIENNNINDLEEFQNKYPVLINNQNNNNENCY